MYNFGFQSLALSYVEALPFLHTLQLPPSGSVLRESSECVYGVGTENSGKLKNMGMSPVSDRKVGEEKR